MSLEARVLPSAASVSALPPVNTVPENAPIGTVVEVDLGLPPIWENTGGYTMINSAGGRFAINGLGVVTVAGPLDYESATSHEIHIFVWGYGEDPEVDTAYANWNSFITISVTDIEELTAINDADAAANTIAMNAANGTPVGLTAAATPASQVVTYSLTDNAGGRFAVDPATGIVTVANASLLDPEVAASHSITVRAASDNGSTFSQTFSIHVTDPAVEENQAAGTPVLTLPETDDQGQPLTYRLVEGEGSSDNRKFSISGNVLKTRARFDFETQSSYTVRVQVRDAAGEISERVLTIAILDVSEAPVGLALSNTRIAEEQLAGTLVGVLSAQDVDAGAQLTYTLVDGPGARDNGLFAIDGTTLRTAAPLDHEQQSSYWIRVRVSDGTSSVERRFRIATQNVNEPPTGIRLSKATIVEGRRPGARIGRLSAIDVDGRGPYQFSLVAGAGDADNDSFTLVGNVLRAKERLDYEDRSEYTIRVRVTDREGVNSEQEFTIRVTPQAR